MYELFHECPRPCLACVFHDLSPISESTQGGLARRGRIETAGHLVFGLASDVRFQFVVHRGFTRSTAEPPFEAFVHQRISRLRMSPIARAICSHFDCSTVSCFLPAAVSL